MSDDDPEIRQRRRTALRTALVLGLIALGVYVTFIILQVQE